SFRSPRCGASSPGSMRRCAALSASKWRWRAVPASGARRRPMCAGPWPPRGSGSYEKHDRRTFGLRAMRIAGAWRLRQEGRSRTLEGRSVSPSISGAGKDSRIRQHRTDAHGAGPAAPNLQSAQSHVSMSQFHYVDGTLHAEEVPLDRLAASVGTPFYCYSTAVLRERHQAFASAFDGGRATICYSLKPNSNQAVIATFARLGAGADVVSEGELRRALAAGLPPERIVFAGVGKTEAELAAGLDCAIAQFNVESLPELEALDRLAVSKGRHARVALRVNPDVDARTHKKIATGKAENKFGIDLG